MDIHLLDHSKAMVLVLVLFCVAYSVLHVQSCLALCSHAFSVLFSIVITSLGGERVNMLLMHSFVYFARNNFCPFSFPLGDRGRLRLVIVALPGHIY